MNKKREEKRDYVYQTSFDVALKNSQTGEKVKKRARILVTRSEAAYYQLINELFRDGKINHHTFLTAEVLCFREGFGRIDGRKNSKKSKDDSSGSTTG